MKKYALSAVIILAFIFYSIVARQEQSPASLPTTSIVPSSPTATDTPIKPVPTIANGINTPIVFNAPSPLPGRYKNGTYTGDVTDAYYGNIQVAAVVENGKLARVNVLQYPNDRDRSIAINTQALPILQSEAIQAQTASVDIVSGATDTSQAFINSLGSALRNAQN